MTILNEQRVSARPEKLREPIWRDVWYVFELFGRSAYADRGLCLLGKPPSKNTCGLEGPGAEGLVKALPRKTGAMKIKSQDSKCVYFENLRLPIDTRYYQHVLAEYPDATFHAPKRNDAWKPIAIKSGGEIVGAVMCIDD